MYYWKLKFALFELQFFPKTEKYVSLFSGGDDSDMVDKRNRLRKQIKANLIAAAASGKDLEGIFFSLLQVLLYLSVGIKVYFFIMVTSLVLCSFIMIKSCKWWICFFEMLAWR